MAVFNRKRCILLLYCGDELVRVYSFPSVIACNDFLLRNKELIKQFTYEIKKSA